MVTGKATTHPVRPKAHCTSANGQLDAAAVITPSPAIEPDTCCNVRVILGFLLLLFVRESSAYFQCLRLKTFNSEAPLTLKTIMI
jgi:hypothetical protein